MNLMTHKDLADLLGVSVTTVKSYRRKFPGCILVANQGKPIRFKPEATQVAVRIRDFFETGMSVPEVRLRLAAEFPWIQAEAPEEVDADLAAPSAPQDRPEAGGELSRKVNDLAKGIVSMGQQQKSILQRMKGIEGILEELDLKGATGADATGEPRSARSRADRDAIIDERLARLDTVTQGLAETMVQLSGHLERFLGNRAKAAEQWRESGGLASLAPELNAAKPAQEAPGNKVIPLHPREGQEPAAPFSIQEGHPGRTGAEPPRSFLTAPLIVRTGQGQTASAGGRGRGRFSLNDVKAMLIYGFSPPNHYTLTWEPHGEGWWLTLSQAAQAEDGGPPRELHLLLMEVPAQTGGSVVEILQLKSNDRNMHPMEFCAIVDSWNAV